MKRTFKREISAMHLWAQEFDRVYERPRDMPAIMKAKEIEGRVPDTEPLALLRRAMSALDITIFLCVLLDHCHPGNRHAKLQQLNRLYGRGMTMTGYHFAVSHAKLFLFGRLLEVPESIGF